MKYRIIIVGLLFFFSSCEKLLFAPDAASKDPLINFDYLWNEVDKKYSYFELKNIDWDSIRIEYRRQLNENSSEEELFEVLANMLNTLKDDHTNLVSPFNVSRFDVGMTGAENYRPRTIQENYIPDLWITGSLQHGFLESNTIGYVRYGSFMDAIPDSDLDFILNRYKDTKGLILDLRSNGGGDISIVSRLLSRFVPTQSLVGYSVTRNGPGRNDFSERQNFTVAPHNGVRYTNPLVVLVDRKSYSATTFFAVATKALSNIILVGDTTGGGGGLPNGGMLPNGWTYRFSVSQVLDVNGNNYAENGVPADIPAAFDWSDVAKDEILDRAILFLNSGS